MSLLRAAAQIVRFLEKEGVPYFIMGGLALQHWGEPRFTRDVDITLLVTSKDLETFVDKILSRFQARIPDARAFAMRHRVLLIQAQNSVPIDLSLGIPGYEEEAFQRSVVVDFPEVGKLRLIGLEDLVIHKCVAGRPRDIEDVESILIRQRMQLNLHLVQRWLTEFQEVIDAHDPLALFEGTVQHAQQSLDQAGENP